MRILALLLLVAAAATAENPDQALLDLLQEDLDARMRRAPTWASSRGDRRFDALLTDASDDARAAWLSAARARLEALAKIDRSKLTPQNLVNAQLLHYEIERRIASARFHPEQIPITQMGGPHSGLAQLPESLSFTKARHYRDYLERLQALPVYFDQLQANMRRGLKEGRTPPRAVLGGVPAQALVHGEKRFETDPSGHAFYLPFRGRPVDDPMAVRAREIIAQQVVPAYRKLGEFLRDEYVPHCRETIAARDLPDGKAYYDFVLKGFTTTDLTADEIHDIGVVEVKRIRDEMMAVIARSDFPGKTKYEGDELFAAFVKYLRTDQRFYYTKAEDLLAGYRDICKRIDAEMPRLFRKLPRLSYGVKEMERWLAPTNTTARYYSGSLKNGRPGFFVANTYRLDQRPRYEMVPLTLHEAVPGHHHQISLAQEMEQMPEWRTILGYTAFVEGWALYAERLGLEVGGPPGSRGMYEDPYDDFGRLTYEMWRAMRLVVDTGIHSRGWSRQKAIDLMLANSALTETNVRREVDRYIAWPGQATAYKIGELKIRELRARAEKALGDGFDIRGFHDALLEDGSVPLPILEAKIARWIAEQAR